VGGGRPEPDGVKGRPHRDRMNRGAWAEILDRVERRIVFVVVHVRCPSRGEYVGMTIVPELLWRPPVTNRRDADRLCGPGQIGYSTATGRHACSERAGFRDAPGEQAQAVQRDEQRAAFVAHDAPRFLKRSPPFDALLARAPSGLSQRALAGVEMRRAKPRLYDPEILRTKRKPQTRTQ
jgi:hypothetical protein